MKFDKSLNKIFAILNLHMILNVSKTFLACYVLLQNLALISTLQKLSQFIDYQFSFLSDICGQFNLLLKFFDSHGEENFQFLFKNILLLLVVQVLLLVVFILFIKLELQSDKQSQLKQDKSLLPMSLIINALYLTKMPLVIIFINFITTEIGFHSYAIVILPLLLIAQIIGLTFVLQQFRNSSNFLNPSPYDKVYQKNQGLLQSVKTLVKALITVGIWSIENDKLIMMLILFLLVSNINDIRTSAVKKTFLHPFTEGLKTVERVINTNCNAVIIIAFLIENETVSYNIVFIIINTCLLTGKAISSYKTYRNRRIILESKTVVKEDEALILMIQVIKAQKIQNGQYFRNSIFHEHKANCTNTQCCCKSMDFANEDKAQRTKSLKRIIKVILKEIVNKQHRSNLLLLSIYLDYQITVLKSFTSIHTATNLFSGHSKSTIEPGEKFILFQIQRAVEANLHGLNECSFVELDVIFRQEDTFKDLLRCIETVNSKNIKKYNLLMQETCDLNIIQDICKEITDNIRKIEEIWDQQEISKSYNIKIFELYLIYCIYILMSREVTNQIRNIMKNKLFVLQSVKGINLNNLSKYMYNRNCCIIESKLVDNKKFGQITNVTSNCSELFKLQRHKMINDNIHSLMANFISGPHEKVSNKWLEDESISGSLKAIIKIIFVDKRGMSFTGNLYLKINSSGSLLVFYAIIIKQSNNDFMILDHQGIIQSFGERLVKEGMVNSSHFQQHFSSICDFNINEEMKENQILKKNLIIRDSLEFISKSAMNQQRKKESAAFSKAIESNSVQQCYYDCNVIFKKEYMGDYQYFLIDFQDIAKIKQKKTHLTFFKFNKTPQLHEIWNNKFKQTKELVRDHKSDDLQLPKLDEEMNNMGGETNSVNSSVSGNETSVKIRKFYDQSRQKMKSTSQITDSCLNKTSIAIVTSVIISSFFIYFQSFLFDANHQSFFKNLRQYSAISFNFMEIEVGFDQMMTVNTFCRNQVATRQKCSELIEVAFINSFEIYQKYFNDFANFMQPILYSNQKQFGYLNLQISNIHNHNKQKSTIKQIIEQFYYSYKILLTQIETNTVRETFYSSQFNFLLDNWPHLQDANSKIQLFYEEIIDEQINVTIYIVLIIIGFLIASTIGIIFFWHSCKKYFENKKFNISLLNAHISRKFCQNYRKILTSLQLSNQIRKQCYYFTQFAQFEQISTKPSRTVKYARSNRYIYFLLLVFLILMVMYACLLVSYMNVIISTPNTVQSIKNIIRSSQKLIWRYITVKEHYLYNDNSLGQEAWKRIQSQLAYPQAEISAQVKKSFSYISQSDESDYQKVFITSICPLLVNQVSNISLFQCFEMKNSVFDFGIMAAVNYIRIQSYTNFVKLKNQSQALIYQEYNSSNESTMNNYGYYIVKVFGLVEDKLTQKFQNSIDSQIANIHSYQIIQTLILYLILIVWLSDIKAFKRTISDLYGEVLQLPKIIFKQAKSNIVHLETFLHFDF